MIERSQVRILSPVFIFFSCKLISLLDLKLTKRGHDVSPKLFLSNKWDFVVHRGVPFKTRGSNPVHHQL